MDLEALIADWDSESVIDNDLEKTVKNIPNLHAKYIRLRSTARMKLRKLKNNQKSLLLTKWKWYEGVLSKEEIDELGWKHDPFEGKKVLKSEYDRFLEADKDVQQSIEKIQYFEEVVATLEEILGALRWRHTHIKNIIESRKFESGY